jgi:hypothetical protein
MAVLCSVPVNEALTEHRTLALPHTYVIGGIPEVYKSKMQLAAKLREKLRAERTNLVPKMIETWDEVPLSESMKRRHIPARREIRGAQNWATGAIACSQKIVGDIRPMLVNGEVGLVWAPHGHVLRVLCFSIADGKIATVEVIAETTRRTELELAVL